MGRQRALPTTGIAEMTWPQRGVDIAQCDTTSIKMYMVYSGALLNHDPIQSEEKVMMVG